MPKKIEPEDRRWAVRAQIDERASVGAVQRGER